MRKLKRDGGLILISEKRGGFGENKALFRGDIRVFEEKGEDAFRVKRWKP